MMFIILHFELKTDIMIMQNTIFCCLVITSNGQIYIYVTMLRAVLITPVTASEALIRQIFNGVVV